MLRPVWSPAPAAVFLAAPVSSALAQTWSFDGEAARTADDPALMLGCGVGRGAVLPSVIAGERPRRRRRPRGRRGAPDSPGDRPALRGAAAPVRRPREKDGPGWPVARVTPFLRTGYTRGCMARIARRTEKEFEEVQRIASQPGACGAERPLRTDLRREAHAICIRGAPGGAVAMALGPMADNGSSAEGLPAVADGVTVVRPPDPDDVRLAKLLRLTRAAV